MSQTSQTPPTLPDIVIEVGGEDNTSLNGQKFKIDIYTDKDCRNIESTLHNRIVEDNKLTIFGSELSNIEPTDEICIKISSNNIPHYVPYQGEFKGTPEDINNNATITMTPAKIKLNLAEDMKDGTKDVAVKGGVTVYVFSDATSCAEPTATPLASKITEDPGGAPSNSVIFTARELGFTTAKNLYFKIEGEGYVTTSFCEEADSLLYDDQVDGTESSPDKNYKKLTVKLAKIKLDLVEDMQDASGNAVAVKDDVKVYVFTNKDECGPDGKSNISKTTKGGSVTFTSRDLGFTTAKNLYFKIEGEGYVTTSFCEEADSLVYDDQVDGTESPSGQQNYKKLTVKLAKIKIVIKEKDVGGAGVPINDVKVKVKKYQDCSDVNSSPVEKPTKTDGPLGGTGFEGGVVIFTSRELGFPTNGTPLFFEATHPGYVGRVCKVDEPNRPLEDIFYNAYSEYINPAEDEADAPDTDNDVVITLDMGCGLLGKKILDNLVNFYNNEANRLINLNPIKPEDVDNAAKAAIKSAYYQWILTYLIAKDITTLSNTVDFTIEPYIYNQIYVAGSITQAAVPAEGSPPVSSYTLNTKGWLIFVEKTKIVNDNMTFEEFMETSIYGKLGPWSGIWDGIQIPETSQGNILCRSFYNRIKK